MKTQKKIWEPLKISVFSGNLKKRCCKTAHLRDLQLAGHSSKNSQRRFLEMSIVPIGRLGFLLALCFVFSCAVFQEQKPNFSKGVKIATWNTQTFFDAVEVGTEYAEFKGKKTKWNEHEYTERLQRISKIIQIISADIIALQEIENEAVMQDIANTFSTTAKYTHMGFFKEEKDVFGIGFFSKIPVESIKTHQIAVRLTKEKPQPQMRPIMQVSFKTDPELVLFICHWKSKSGGEENTQIWRELQKSLLLQHVAELVKPAEFIKQKEVLPVIAVLGDFNQDVSKTAPKSFWDAYDTIPENPKIGSYNYKQNWERIDNILLFGQPDFDLTKPLVENSGGNADSSGAPFSYSVFKGSGFSDHFPISAVLTNK